MPIVPKTAAAIEKAIEKVESKPVGKKVAKRSRKKRGDKYENLLEEKGITAPIGDKAPIVSILDKVGAGINPVASTLAQLLHSGEDGVRLNTAKTLMELHGYLKKNEGNENNTQINIVIEGSGEETIKKVNDVLCPQR